MASLDRRYKSRGLQVVGLHSPEFDEEKEPELVRRGVGVLGITYPVVLDNDLKMWDALGNSYWPTLYLLDRTGKIRSVHVGEVHEGDREARDFERALEAVLAERAPAAAGR